MIKRTWPNWRLLLTQRKLPRRLLPRIELISSVEMPSSGPPTCQSNTLMDISRLKLTISDTNSPRLRPESAPTNPNLTPTPTPLTRTLIEDQCKANHFLAMIFNSLNYYLSD